MQHTSFTDSDTLGKYTENLDRQLLDAVAAAMTEPELTPQERMERKFDWIIRELDEICAMANDPETVELVEEQKIGLGQIISRSQLIASFLLARKPGPKVVVNNG